MLLHLKNGKKICTRSGYCVTAKFQHFKGVDLSERFKCLFFLSDELNTGVIFKNNCDSVIIVQCSQNVV